jgi:DNA repair photolyase
MAQAEKTLEKKISNEPIYRTRHRDSGRATVKEQNMRVHHWQLKTGISSTPEFERKRLASHAVNVGIKCGHGCLYCSTGAVLRMHGSFHDCGENPFAFGYAIVDPSTPERVARDAERIQKRGLVQLCTLTDAWAPEAQEHRLGRRCLEAILSHPGWAVRILTKNEAIRDDFDFIEKHTDRVLVGLSITGPLHAGTAIQILEPNASSIEDRMLALIEAAARGLRTYAMFCPLLPGIADSPETVDRFIKFAVDCRAEEIFVEPVNPRGPGLRLCQEALEQKGFTGEAKAIAVTRQRAHWSQYVAELVSRTQQAVRKHSDISKLRFLLYPWGLRPEDKARIQRDDAGVVWLGENATAGSGPCVR